MNNPNKYNNTNIILKGFKYRNIIYVHNIIRNTNTTREYLYLYEYSKIC